MATSRLVKDIADALVAEALEQQVLPQVMLDLKYVAQAFQLDSLLSVDLDEVCITLERRRVAVQRALIDAVHPLTLGAVLALQRRSLLGDFEAMRAAALQAAETAAEYREALVRTAVSLTEEELATLARQLKERFGGMMAIEEHIDSSIIGGLRITIGDWTIDDSLTGKLQRLTHALYV